MGFLLKMKALRYLIKWPTLIDHKTKLSVYVYLFDNGIPKFLCAKIEYWWIKFRIKAVEAYLPGSSFFWRSIKPWWAYGTWDGSRIFSVRASYLWYQHLEIEQSNINRSTISS